LLYHLLILGYALQFLIPIGFLCLTGFKLEFIPVRKRAIIVAVNYKINIRLRAYSLSS
jgi:hypothetical protein